MLNLYQFLLVMLCFSAIWYNCYAIYAAIQFFSRPTHTDCDFHPPVTILKPICGLDINTYENFASFCKQDYPEYQIIFSVRDERDPCIAVVNTIIKDFPDLDIRLAIGDRTIGTNHKVSNLANAQAESKYSFLVLADSDVQVRPDYLKQVIQPMSDSSVGVVTCLYRPQVRGWVAIFEAIGISTEYLAGVLVARYIEGMNFALGPTIAIRTNVLEEIGGFQAIADYLADDFQLGYLSARAGYTVVLSNYIIDHAIATENFIDLIQRQIRWNCCTRVSRPWGYLGLMSTYGIASSLLLSIATFGSIFSWVILGIVLTTRLMMAWVVGVRSLKDPVARKFLFLVPLRDLISFALWCYGFVGNTFEWRGRKLKLTRGGKLIPLTSNSLQN
ncbi:MULTISPECIES: bacteriohopanetetrol glucosamine biosynthesis glycosyltransferase HpnI [Nostocales]|uniref:Glycosyl transferase n=3 Tax=Nostocales TaxID=1161 RepID=A0A0C1NHG8_9CYAN|nr:bacteriohopanetetrol glucosamine biosynthesis glycosyltransferase HpnI [Tolypothrix bouteillei]KAF3890375.1 glycosyltransferase [Tolypothrix bouteillei VB521301]